jgi:sugar-specific transcriptional regulator TrmB
MINPEQQLTEIFNLKPYEGRLYRAALGGTETSLTNLAKRARIPRTAAYRPVQSLVRHGFLLPIKIGKRIHYRGMTPNRLARVLENKQVALAALLPLLNQVQSIANDKIEVTYYPGVDGLVVASDIFLDESRAKIWKIFENPLHTLEAAGIPRMEEYVRRRVAQQIVARVVAPSDITDSQWLRKKTSQNDEELREVLLVSQRVYPIDASIVTDGESVLVLVAQGATFAVLIKSPALARTIDSIHDMVWDRFRAE